MEAASVTEDIIGWSLSVGGGGQNQAPIVAMEAISVYGGQNPTPAGAIRAVSHSKPARERASPIGPFDPFVTTVNAYWTSTEPLCPPSVLVGCVIFSTFPLSFPFVAI